MQAILVDVPISRLFSVTVLVVVLSVAVVTAVVFRKHLKSTAEASAYAAAAEARAVLLKRSERQLQYALSTTRAALAEAKAITLYHVANELDKDYSSLAKNPRVAGYPVRQQTDLRRVDAERLVALLTARDTYLRAGDAWSCIFEPRHVLQLMEARETISVIICVHCGEVEFVIGKDSIGARSIHPKPNDELSRILQDLLKSEERRTANDAAAT